ncbi:MAG: glycosyltransferase [Blastocatellia bacterium]
MKILWLKTELLHPVDKGGRIRTYQMLRALRRNHHVTYLTLDDGAMPEAQTLADEYCQELICMPHRLPSRTEFGFYAGLGANLLSGLPYAVARYRSALMREAITRQVQRDKPDVLVCDFLAPAINVPERLPCRTVLFQHNVEAQIWQRHFETQTNPLRRALFRFQWQRMKRFEHAACQRFDQIIAVSQADADRLRHDYEIDRVAAVPTGVDTDFFRPRPEVATEPHHLVFTGSMDWLPNEDGINWFIEQIWPQLRQQIPQIRLTVVGRNPSRRLLALNQTGSGINVTGTVDDVRPYLARAAAAIVPLRIGGGTRLKIYEAMAMSKPVISTTVGAEGLPLRDGRELLIADEPSAFAAVICRLVKEPSKAREIGAAGASFVSSSGSWQAVTQQFLKLCEA